MVAKKPKKQIDKGEILPPEQADSPANINILAIIQNSQSPKEVLEFLEEHDPGITKRIIQKNEAFADKSQASRFRFGERQAYIALATRIVFGLIICGAVFYALYLKASLFSLVGLAVLLAITQGGSPMWRRIGNALASRIEKDE